MIKFTRSLAVAAAAAGVLAFAASGASAAEPTVCTDTIENAVVGDVMVPYDASCTLKNVIVNGSVTAELDALAVTLSGAVVTGDVAVESRRLDVRRTVVVGGISAGEASDGASVTSSAVGGDARFVNIAAGLTLGSADSAGAGNVFGGDVEVTRSFGRSLLGFNAVSGNLVVRGARAAMEIRRNAVGGALDCSGSTPAPAGGSNLAGSKLGQCAAL
jgi:hypothetical protein